jgi:hypothetical protein
MLTTLLVVIMVYSTGAFVVPFSSSLHARATTTKIHLSPDGVELYQLLSKQMREQLAELRHDVSEQFVEVRHDLAEVKRDVSSLKKDVSALQRESSLFIETRARDFATELFGRKFTKSLTALSVQDLQYCFRGEVLEAGDFRGEVLRKPVQLIERGINKLVMDRVPERLLNTIYLKYKVRRSTCVIFLSVFNFLFSPKL